MAQEEAIRQRIVLPPQPNKSLDASGGSVFRNLLGAAEGALIRAAASNQPLCARLFWLGDQEPLEEKQFETNPAYSIYSLRNPFSMRSANDRD